MESGQNMKKLTLNGSPFRVADEYARNEVDAAKKALSALEAKTVNGLAYEGDKLYLVVNGEKITESEVTIVAGTGGSSNNAVMNMKNTSGWLQKTIAFGSDCVVNLTWSSIEEGVPTGDGSMTIEVNGSKKLAKNVAQGDHTISLKEYLVAGDNTVRLQISDVYGNSRAVVYTISAVSISLASTFDATTPFTGPIAFPYTPTGEAEKKVVFIIDGNQVGSETVSVSGRQRTFTFEAQEHGEHVIEVYFTAVVAGETITSNTLRYSVMCLEEGKTTPIIAASVNSTKVEQYGYVIVQYTAYDPVNLTTGVVLSANGEEINSLTVDRTLQTWTYRASAIGETILSIACGSIKKEIKLNVTESTIQVEAETEDMALYLSSYGRSNNEGNPGVWEFGDIASQFSGFNWKSDGWQTDDDGITVLRVSGDARLTIPLLIFENDFRSTGKTIEIEFATRDVLNYDAVLLSCMSGGRGIEVTTQRAMLTSEQSSIGTQYKEEEHVRLTFVVEKRSGNKLLLCYINGILSGTTLYSDDEDFSQADPVGITIGSNECTTDIYCIRVYDNDLTRHQILDNWIADTQDIATRHDRYARNNIYDAYGNITLATLKKDVPYLVLESAVLPQSKGDKKTCSGYYVDPVNPKKNFRFEGAEIDVQGTSSQYYYVKNYKIKFKGGFIRNDGLTVPAYQLNDAVVPTSTYTFKADVASSEGANNVVLAKLYNDLCPVKTPPQEEDPRVRQTIDGHPIVIFWDNGSGSPQFIGKYNFNHDKGTEEVFGFEDGDESWEILQNGTDRVGWKSADFSGNGWKNDFEARFPEDNTNTANLAAFAAWVVSTNTEAATNAPLRAAVTIDDVEYTTDSAEYRLAKFKAELPDHASVENLVFYYVFTELFLCIDQREKNAFPTLFEDMDRWIMLFYDADSSLGIDNKGNLAFDYYLEDIDYTEAGDPIFNGQGSVLWVNLRDAFYSEITALYKKLRTDLRGDGSGNPLISYDVVNNLFESHQGTWSEAIYNEDGFRKSIEPYELAGDTLYLPMLQGKKEQQRKWWLYNRFRYLDSKYCTGSSMNIRITIRAHQKANIKLTSYVNMYGHVYYNAEMVEHRMFRGQEYEFEWSASGAEDPVIGINDADMLTSLGDLSPLMVELIDISKATHLTSLKVGDASENYRNINLNSITLGNNVLLRTLDLRNCAALTQHVNASGCTGLEEAYLDGTSITGISLPNGGNLKVLHLPGTITNLAVLNQKAITDFTMAGYDNVTTLRVENSPAIPVLDILYGMPANSRVRIIGFIIDNTSATEVIALCDILDAMRGIDEYGNNTDKAQVSGTVYIDSLTSEELYKIQSRYPNINVVYNTITLYTIRFWNEDVLLQTVENVAYNSSVKYTGEKPLKEGETDHSRWEFYRWVPAPDVVTGDMDCYAEFKFKGSYARELIQRTIEGKYENERVAVVGDSAFYQATSIVSVSMPEVTSIRNTAFRGCTSLTDVYFPKVTSVYSRAFDYTAKLSSACFPSLDTCDSGAFQNSHFAKLDLPVATYIGTVVFSNATKLETLILRNEDAVCTIYNTGVFSGTKIASGTGYIYVPRSMVDSYKVATNWTDFADQIRAIEDYPDICGGE